MWNLVHAEGWKVSVMFETVWDFLHKRCRAVMLTRIGKCGVWQCGGDGVCRMWESHVGQSWAVWNSGGRWCSISHWAVFDSVVLDGVYAECGAVNSW